jgi:phenylacetate-coenzyme A ligase PaaK-like adenylate-forming protein
VTAWIGKPYWNAFLAWHTFFGVRLLDQPLEKIIAVQRRRLRSLVQYAYTHVTHYRELMERTGLRPDDFQTAEALERLPLVSREELLDAPQRFIGADYRGGKGLVLHSSGTSGRARTIVYDPRALFLALANGYRQRRALSSIVGRSFGYREVDLSRAGSLGSQLRAFYEAHSWVPPGVELQRQFISPAEPFESVRDRLNQFRPHVLRGYGSLIGAFFRWLHERELTLAPLKAVQYGGDRMAEADRRLIENEFRIPVYSTYQAAEALLIAYQCKHRQGFHISLDQVAVRVVDPQGRSVPPGGTGEVVLTNLTNRATVLINLKLGDIAKLAEQACPCGCPLPVLGSIEGRTDDLIMVPGGSLLHPLSTLPPLQGVPGVVQVQLVQQELRRFQLRVVCSKGTDWDATAAQLAETFYSLLGRDLHLEVQRVERLAPEPSGKVKGVVSQCRA